MSDIIGRVSLGLGLLVVLGAANVTIAQKEMILASGERLLLELAPVDPRSLMQGDYMRLDYRMARDLSGARLGLISSLFIDFIGDQASEADLWPAEGRIVVRRAAGTVSDVAEFVRLDDGQPTAPDELFLYYRKRGGQTRIGTDAFYFQEGKADTYSGARYGELRVDSSGGSVLVGLCGEDGKGL